MPWESHTFTDTHHRKFIHVHAYVCPLQGNHHWAPGGATCFRSTTQCFFCFFRSQWSGSSCCHLYLMWRLLDLLPSVSLLIFFFLSQNKISSIKIFFQDTSGFFFSFKTCFGPRHWKSFSQWPKNFFAIILFYLKKCISFFMHASHSGAGNLHVKSFLFLQQWLSELFLTSATWHDKTWYNSTQQLNTETFTKLSLIYLFFSFKNREVRM